MAAAVRKAARHGRRPRHAEGKINTRLGQPPGIGAGAGIAAQGYRVAPDGKIELVMVTRSRCRIRTAGLLARRKKL